jgi:preprotein translocase subunit SecG
LFFIICFILTVVLTHKTKQTRAPKQNPKKKHDRYRCEDQCGFFIFFHS